jgi:methylenetetrahydrofolate dehydrogenase (NADP+)/methenyltetrahydrofolate cyclohydrolase
MIFAQKTKLYVNTKCRKTNFAKMKAMQILDGKLAAQKIREDVARDVGVLRGQGIQPGLGVVLVGDDPASRVYVGMKERACEAAGIRSIAHHLPQNASREQVLEAVHALNQNPDAHGILVQAPLPNNIDYDEIAAAILPEKDVDGVGPFSMGNLLADQPGYAACTAAGIIELLKAYAIPLQGKECVVVGRSVIVGKPVALLMLRENATVTICHSRTADLKSHTRRADILIAAVGKPELITGEMIKDGAVVVDAGYNRVEGRKGDVGDVEYSSALHKASWITPVPGGVGPMTIAMLLKQTLLAAQRN